MFHKIENRNPLILGMLALSPTIVLALLIAQPAVGLEKPQQRQLQSITETQSLSFDGREFVLKSKAENPSVPLYEYFLANESPSEWTELVDFRIEPKVPHSNKPVDHAARTAKLFKEKFPLMPFAMYKNDRTGEAVLDFLVPLPNNESLEFNAFRFYAVGLGQSGVVLSLCQENKRPK